MCDTMKLKGKMKENGMTQEGLAAAIKIDRSTLNRRLKTGEDFTIGEANRIVSVLMLTADEALSIFYRNCRNNATYKHRKGHKT